MTPSQRRAAEIAATFHLFDHNDRDDEPRARNTLKGAMAYARVRSEKIGAPVGVYAVTNEGEIYLGSVEA